MPLDSAPSLVVAAFHFEPLAHQGLVSTLARHPHFHVVAHPSMDHIDVVLWDGDALAFQPEANDLPTVVITSSEETAKTALSLGAKAVVHRQSLKERLQGAINAVLSDLIVVDPLFENALPPKPRPQSPALFEKLTGREHEVLTLLAEGHSNRKIAKQLGISPHTVKFHIGALLEKFDADTRTEVVVRAARLGLLIL